MKIWKWLKQNIFPTWYHSIISIVIIIFLLATLPKLLNWFIFKANFTGDTSSNCISGGACWVFIRMRFEQFMYGFYPRDLVWRINLSYILAVILIAGVLYTKKSFRKAFIALLTIVFPIVAIILYHGGMFGLEEVDSYSWSGLHLTLILTFGGILFALPLGILLALCRASSLPVFHRLSVMFIELWRGVPLVLVLFMAFVLTPMFLTPGLHIDRVLRALIGITLFYSAYMAETIFIGLKSLPRGQFEAVNALDFSYWQGRFLVILPQVLRENLQNIVRICIRLFKETTLVLIIGLYDFLGMVQAASQDPNWLAFGLEGYIFAAFVYWIICFTITKFGKHAWQQLKTGNK